MRVLVVPVLLMLGVGEVRILGGGGIARGIQTGREIEQCGVVGGEIELVHCRGR